MLKDQHHQGQYKTLSNQVVANYPNDTQQIIAQTTDPHLTPYEMQGPIR